MHAQRRTQPFAVVFGGLAVICSACGGASPRTAGRAPAPADSVSGVDGSKRTADDQTGAVSVIRQEDLDNLEWEICDGVRRRLHVTARPTPA